MDLAGDCLDNLLVDRHGASIGRVDGVVIAIERNGQPRVVAIESGAVTCARRVHPRIGHLVRRMARKFGKATSDPYRVPWEGVSFENGACKIDVDADSVPTRAWERWLRERVIGRIWGA